MKLSVFYDHITEACAQKQLPVQERHSPFAGRDPGTERIRPENACVFR